MDIKDFSVKLAFNKCLKIMKNLKNVIKFFKKVDPSEFTIVIYETNIVSMSTNGRRARTPYIKKTSSNCLVEILVETGYCN